MCCRSAPLGIWRNVVRQAGDPRRMSGLVVVPDRSGQREDARQDAGDDALWGASAVLFQVKLALEGPVDGLDDLPQRLEQVLPGAAGLAPADPGQQRHVTLGVLFFSHAA